MRSNALTGKHLFFLCAIMLFSLSRTINEKERKGTEVLSRRIIVAPFFFCTRIAPGVNRTKKFKGDCFTVKYILILRWQLLAYLVVPRLMHTWIRVPYTVLGKLNQRENWTKEKTEPKRKLNQRNLNQRENWTKENWTKEKTEPKEYWTKENWTKSKLNQWYWTKVTEPTTAEPTRKVFFPIPSLPLSLSLFPSLYLQWFTFNMCVCEGNQERLIQQQKIWDFQKQTRCVGQRGRNQLRKR